MSGWVQYLGFLPMAQALMIILVLAGMVYPSISHFSIFCLGTNIATGGCSLKASLITNFRYFSSPMFASSTIFLLSLNRCGCCRTSSWALLRTRGLRNISDIAHSIIELVVSLPPVNIS
ncbi:hypothetical protein LINPERHAP2_LOCUS30875 [Linum perenne]